MNNLCESCGSEKKLIPAGVSKKTGRPYKEFWTCPNRCNSKLKSVIQGDSMLMEEMVDFRREVNERLDKLISYVVDKLK